MYRIGNYLLVGLLVMALGRVLLEEQATEQASTSQACEPTEGIGEDILIQALQEAINEIAQKFEIRDRLESQLVFREIIGKKKEAVEPSTISIVLFRPTGCLRQTKTYEKKYDDWELHFNRVESDRITSPVAIITVATVIKGFAHLEEKILHYEKGEWRADKMGNKSN